MRGKVSSLHGVIAAEKSDKGSKHTAGDRGHAARHHAHQFRSGHLVQVGTDQQRAFGLTEKHVTRCRQALWATELQCPGHQPGKSTDEQSQNAEVVEQGTEGTEKYDGRKNAKSKINQLGRHFASHHETTKEEFASVIGVADHPNEAPGYGRKYTLNEGRFQNEQRQNELQSQRASNRAPTDGRAFGREQHADARERNEAEQGLKNMHANGGEVELLAGPAVEFVAQNRCSLVILVLYCSIQLFLKLVD